MKGPESVPQSVPQSPDLGANGRAKARSKLARLNSLMVSEGFRELTPATQNAIRSERDIASDLLRDLTEEKYG